MALASNKQRRIEEVLRFFEEEGIGNADFLESWDGEDLADLEPVLTQEEFEALLDRLGEEDSPRG